MLRSYQVSRKANKLVEMAINAPVDGVTTLCM